MKINRFKVTFILLSLLASVALSGCSNEDNIESQPQEGMAKISFKINEKDYEAGEQVAGTRAAAPTKPELQDLGNGWMAEVSLEPDTTHAKEAKAAEAKTRAIYVPAHYTIQAYQGGVKKGELKGTFQGSTFTPDAGTAESIFLPHGTYDFVCFNDKVSANGTQFTVHRADAGTARFTVQRGVVINQDPKQYVAFEMKHAGAHITMNLVFANFSVHMFGTNETLFIPTIGMVVYKARSVNPTDHIESTWTSNPNSIPETMNYDFATNTYSYPAMGNFSHFNAANWGNVMSPGYTGIITPVLDTGADFFLPTTDCANLKFTITDGSLYDRSLTGMIKVPAHTQLEANKQYLLVVRLLMTKPLYLFSDGTIGDLDKNVGKTPIGVLPKPDGDCAIALNDVENSPGSPVYTQWSNATSQESSTFTYTKYKDLLEMGYTGSYYGHNVPALQTVASYRTKISMPATIGLGAPALRDFLWAGVSFAGLPEGKSRSSEIYMPDYFKYLIPAGASTTGFTPGPSNINFPSMNMTKFNKAFTDAGGTAPQGRYWTGTEVIDGGQAKQVVIDISSSGYRIDFASKQSSAKIRPVFML